MLQFFDSCPSLIKSLGYCQFNLEHLKCPAYNKVGPRDIAKVTLSCHASEHRPMCEISGRAIAYSGWFHAFVVMLCSVDISQSEE